MSDNELRSVRNNLIAAIHEEDWPKAASQLPAAKRFLLKRNALIPSSDAPKHMLLGARDILEIGAVVSIHTGQEEGFERYHAQLQPFYEDASLHDPPSTNRTKVIGLYLLLLLSRNRIADFHAALENLDVAEMEDEYIQYPVELERWLMEGSYDKVWHAAQESAAPSAEFALFVKVLITTIRDEIASCSEKAYSSLPVTNAKNLLFLDSDRAVVDFAQNRGWSVKDGRIYFPEEATEKEVLDSTMLIDRTIHYAQELETIV